MLPRSLPWTLRSNYVLLFAVINKIQSAQDGAIPQDKLTNLLSEQEDIHCNPHPETHQVLLPELCQIHYPSNGTTVRAFFYTPAHYPNCLCKAASEVCSETRCCCGPTEMTNLTYVCPGYLGGESVLVSDIPTKCECQPLRGRICWNWWSSCSNQLIVSFYYISAIIHAIYASMHTTPKIRFPTCPAYQNMIFPTHIWQRIW